MAAKKKNKSSNKSIEKKLTSVVSRGEYNPETRMKEMEAKLLALAKDHKNKRSNFNPSSCVEIKHEDGSYFFLKSAFVIYENGVRYVFSEHNGNSWYTDEDTEIVVYKRQ